jgi:transposase
MGSMKNMGSNPALTISNACLTAVGILPMHWKTTCRGQAMPWITSFGPLYDIEDECKVLDLDYDSITDRRQSQSVPILNEFKEWLAIELPKTTEGAPIYKAIAYAIRHFRSLIKYTADGMLEIDNNNLEGQIRAVAVGRGNYLFAGSHRGGELGGIIYSFMATCKLQNIDPSKWLDDVLRRTPNQLENKLSQLLPQFWKPLSEKKAQRV